MKILSMVIFSVIFFMISAHQAAAEKTYIVKKGDTVYKIAKKFGASPEKVKKTNNLGSGKLLPGAKLVIPAGKSPKSRHFAKKAASLQGHNKDSHVSDQEGSRETQYHIVRKGDSLHSISREYSVTVNDLMEINNIDKPRKIKIGQKIMLQKTGPRSYTVKKGDNIWKISKRFDMAAEEIMEINDLESEDLRPGQKLALEDWIAQPNIGNYAAILSEYKITEDLKELSESPDLNSISFNDRVKLFSKKMLDIPYKFGGTSFMGMDCSAYVQKVFGLLSVPFPRTAREQFNLGEPVNKENLLTGDLVFFRTYASFPSHVGIYLGDNLFIHASSKNRKVTIDSLDTPYFIKRFIGAKRIVAEDNETEDDMTEES